MNQTTLLAAIFTLVVVSAAMSIDFGWGDSGLFTINTTGVPAVSAWGMVAMTLPILSRSQSGVAPTDAPPTRGGATCGRTQAHSSFFTAMGGASECTL
ncbi:MAG: hypothetical protein WBE26_00250 [Phycisphaerae bacterium]